MNIHFKLTTVLIRAIRTDLARRHEVAAERVGFISCRVASTNEGIVVLAEGYHPVADEDYLDDPRVGAMMGPAAIRKALQFAYGERVAMFHVHMHKHRGNPWFSGLDLKENAKFVPDFWNVRPEFPHGAIVLSSDSVAGLCWYPQAMKPIRIGNFTMVGTPMQLVRGDL
jgi:hypothetical protein